MNAPETRHLKKIQQSAVVIDTRNPSTPVAEAQSIDAAAIHMEGLAKSAPPYTTLAVLDQEGRVVASASNARIQASIAKLMLQAPHEDRTVVVGETDVDVTNIVLALPYESVVAIDDWTQNHNIGREAITWPGPIDVQVADEIALFFGVRQLADLTQENFDYVRRNLNFGKPKTLKMPVMIEVEVTDRDGHDLQALLDRLSFSVHSDQLKASIVHISPKR
jgi:hypothetical protein